MLEGARPPHSSAFTNHRITKVTALICLGSFLASLRWVSISGSIRIYAQIHCLGSLCSLPPDLESVQVDQVCCWDFCDLADANAICIQESESLPVGPGAAAGSTGGRK
ncbi:hypothetical protein L1887_55591 [Cichorium endivia]|nr:hypothetical protein L1887_55591 [Cichorium endivia]